MRKIADVQPEVRVGAHTIRRLILYDDGKSTFVFPCSSRRDGSAVGDDMFMTLAEAEAHCAERYGVQACDWKDIADPLPGCQSDWISPVRAKGFDACRPEWGVFERLSDDGAWHEVRPGSE